MKTGVYRSRPPELMGPGMKTDEIACAYAGCRDGVGFKKSASVAAKFAGRDVSLKFGGFTDPILERPVVSNARFSDLPPDEIIGLGWRRMQFFSNHPEIGDISFEMRVDGPPSRGRIISLSNGRIGNLDTFSDFSGLHATGNFFPAINENEIYFRVKIPSIKKTFISHKPLRNSSVVTEIPPLNVDYHFAEPLEFVSEDGDGTTFTIEDCIISITILKNVTMEVHSISALSSEITEIQLLLTNTSDVEDVTIAIFGESTAGIRAMPAKQIISLSRESKIVKLNCDHSLAKPPGTLTIGAILIEPYESRGSNNMIFDLQELRLAKILDTPDL